MKENKMRVQNRERVKKSAILRVDHHENIIEFFWLFFCPITLLLPRAEINIVITILRLLR